MGCQIFKSLDDLIFSSRITDGAAKLWTYSTYLLGITKYFKTYSVDRLPGGTSYMESTGNLFREPGQVAHYFKGLY